MRLRAIRDLIAHARRECEHAAVSQCGAEFAFETQQYMPFLAPVIGEITRRVLDHPHAEFAEPLGAPACSVRAIADQSVVPKGMLSIFMPMSSSLCLHAS
jgi:hypothetical protein